MATHRIQFDLDDGQLAEFEALMAEGGVSTKRELLNNAITILGWAMDEVNDGRVIASLDEKAQSYKQLSMPILSGKKSKARRAKRK